MTVTLRDLPVQITIADSCNCFNWCCKDNRPVYVTHDWIAEPFDFKKSKNVEEDNLKTQNRIRELFKALDECFVCNRKFIIFNDNNNYITFTDIKEINNYLKLFDI